MAAETTFMPLRPKSLNNHIRHWFSTPFTLGAEPIRVTTHTPRITILFDIRRRLLKWIATLGTEEMTRVPFGAASNNYITLNGCLAGLAAW